ncbi:MAG: Fe-S cluster assembly protein NifU [Candidatus Krumholzibacteriia bacterium]
MWNYSEKVLDHFMNPRNVGDVEEPDGVGEVGSMACGDALRLSFKLDDEGRIAEARFRTFGCGSAIASSSILTELIQGKTLEEAAQITNEDIARELGGLPREKMHCSVMGREALEAAMIDYFRKRGRTIPCDLLSQGVMLCHCFQVTRDTVRDAILANGLETVEDVTYYTKAGGGCGDCHGDIEELLAETRQTRPGQQPAPASGPLVQLGAGAADARERETEADRDLQRHIREVLENDIAVALRNDGGDIELVRYRDGKVFVRLAGNCAACKLADVTLKDYVEQQLREHVRDDLRVIEVKA